MLFSCKNCQDRIPGCHSVCDKYINEKTELDERNERKHEKQKVEHYVFDMVNQNRERRRQKLRFNTHRR